MKIEDILKELPEGYKEAGWETKALRRKRGIQNEDILLTLCLYYGYDKSLVDTKIYAQSFLSTKISDVGFMKRFAACKEWFKWMNQKMTEECTPIYSVPEKLSGKTVKAVDASDICTKGAVKQTWRLHYAFDLFSMSSSEFHITPESNGETLENLVMPQTS